MDNPGPILGKKRNSMGKPYKPAWLRTHSRGYLPQPSTHPVRLLLISLYPKPCTFPLLQAEQFLSALINWGSQYPQCEYQAIKSLKPSKAPGPDGFSGLYYKTFFAPLAPHLANYFYAFKHGSMPFPEALQAHISIAPKMPEDTSKPQAFWPISFSNDDL